MFAFGRLGADKVLWRAARRARLPRRRAFRPGRGSLRVVYGRCKSSPPLFTPIVQVERLSGQRDILHGGGIAGAKQGHWAGELARSRLAPPHSRAGRADVQASQGHLRARRESAPAAPAQSRRHTARRHAHAGPPDARRVDGLRQRPALRVRDDAGHRHQHPAAGRAAAEGAGMPRTSGKTRREALNVHSTWTRGG